MHLLKLLLRLVAGVIAGFVYVWFAAVRFLPAAKRRKAARRQARFADRPHRIRTPS